jgi:hypothetical protein
VQGFFVHHLYFYKLKHLKSFYTTR